jgi:hypothetical protein
MMKWEQAVAQRSPTRTSRRGIGGPGVLAVVVMLALPCAASSAESAASRLPPPARVDCGNSGVAGAGFTVYVCSSGAGGTKYAHGPELLVVRTNGSYTGYRDTFSQADIVRRLPSGEVIASHNNDIVRVTASALTILVGERRLSRVPDSQRMGYINALTVDSSGDIFLRANYWAVDRHGCENARWELSAAGNLKLLWRSKTGLTCG